VLELLEGTEKVHHRIHPDVAGCVAEGTGGDLGSGLPRHLGHFAKFVEGDHPLVRVIGPGGISGLLECLGETEPRSLVLGRNAGRGGERLDRLPYLDRLTSASTWLSTLWLIPSTVHVESASRYSGKGIGWVGCGKGVVKWIMSFVLCRPAIDHETLMDHLRG